MFTAIDENGKIYEFESKKTENGFSLKLKKEKLEGVGRLYALSALSLARVGDEGYYVVPGAINQNGSVQTFFIPRPDAEYEIKSPVMGFYGIKTSDKCLLIRPERSYNYSFKTVLKNGEYSLCTAYDFTPTLNHESSEDFLDCDIKIEIIELPSDSDYNDMAACERELRLSRGEISTLREKCRRDCVEYARKYPLIRIRMGWKESPSPILHQTAENEPDMYVACDFKRVRDIADELKRQGVEGAELQLVGWHASGHDGRFPQLFPADERLGGNREMKKTFDYVKKLGYRISTHTNTIDSVEVANSFTWDDVCLKSNGEYLQKGHYSGGLAYHNCPIKQLKNAKRDLPELLEYGENGLHFTDVISITVPDVCYNENHKCSTDLGMKYIKENIEYTSELFGGFSSEGCMDFTMKNLDYGLYVSFGNAFGEDCDPFVDRYLPLWEITYHGTMLYNPLSATVNYPIKSPKDKLTFVMRGGKPSFYIYSRFRTGDVNWMGESDLIATTDCDLKKTVSIIKQANENYQSLCDKQLQFIAGYDFLENGLQRVRYCDGSEIIGNFSEKTTEFEGEEIEPYGYIER